MSLKVYLLLCCVASFVCFAPARSRTIDPSPSSASGSRRSRSQGGHSVEWRAPPGAKRLRVTYRPRPGQPRMSREELLAFVRRHQRTRARKDAALKRARARRQRLTAKKRTERKPRKLAPNKSTVTKPARSRSVRRKAAGTPIRRKAPRRRSKAGRQPLRRKPRRKSLKRRPSSARKTSYSDMGRVAKGSGSPAGYGSQANRKPASTSSQKAGGSLIRSLEMLSQANGKRLRLDNLDRVKDKTHLAIIRAMADKAKYGEFTGKGLEMKVVQQIPDAQTMVHFRLLQHFNGLPILGTETVVREFTCASGPLRNRLSTTGRVEGELGRTFSRNESLCVYQGAPYADFSMPDFPDLSQPQFDAAKRIAALKAADAAATRFGAERSDNVIYTGKREDEPPRVLTRVSYFVRGGGSKRVARPYRLIDPSSGEVVDEFDSLSNLTLSEVATESGGSEKVGEVPVKDLRVYKSGSDCVLETEDIFTLALDADGKPLDKDPVLLDCPGGTVEAVQEANGGFSPLTDAHNSADKVFLFYREQYKKNPLMRAVGKLAVEVGGVAEDNAFWNGDSVVIYNGDKIFHPLTGTDILAHEVAHGLVEVTSDLEYRDESGGINEAFADITGKTVEAFLKGGQDQITWALGADIKKTGTGIRFMDEPSKDGDSIEHAADYREGMDVHFSSGLFNKAFHRLVTRPGSSFNIFSAYDVFYAANTYHWTKRVGFLEASEDLLTALDDLKDGRYFDYDYSDLKTEDLVLSLEDVGIGCEEDEVAKSSERRRKVSGRKFVCFGLDKRRRRHRAARRRRL